MLNTDWQKRVRAWRSDARRREKEGWELIQENGHPLWQIHRGNRIGHKIVAAEVAIDGSGVWIKISDNKDQTP